MLPPITKIPAVARSPCVRHTPGPVPHGAARVTRMGSQAPSSHLLITFRLQIVVTCRRGAGWVRAVKKKKKENEPLLLNNFAHPQKVAKLRVVQPLRRKSVCRQSLSLLMFFFLFFVQNALHFKRQHISTVRSSSLILHSKHKAAKCNTEQAFSPVLSERD